MTMKFIHKLKIANYKSIDSLELTNLPPFAVFAGANGAGKSNFFDALVFVRAFLFGGVEHALRAHGGFEHVHSAKRGAANARKFDFEIESEHTDGGKLRYAMSIDRLDSTPQIAECMSVNETTVLERAKGEPPTLINAGKNNVLDQFPATYSALLFFKSAPFQIANMLRDLRIYRIDPMSAKEPSKSDSDPTALQENGHNLAGVLHRLEKDAQSRETIGEWMEVIAPGLEKMSTEKQRLDSKTAILFKEQGTRKQFPAHMVSDGTMYALCMLVAVLDSMKKPGLTLLEEPERGLHPKAIFDLIDLMRECASPSNPIWLTTHSESVVRSMKLPELILVNKVDGRTEMKPAAQGNLTDADIKPLGLDRAWLSNLFGAGLPW
ncbi:MAG: AAA family ATPase [Gammaproteobacteria bacterium]